MADVHDTATRSRNMAAIRGKDTKPELHIRRALHSLGFRYRLHAKDLPGKPDLVFPRYGAVVFINGCFWHRHDCHLFRWPGTRVDFWQEKIGKNVASDARNINALDALGWRIATVWECALKGRTRLPDNQPVQLLAEWLRSEEKRLTIRGN
ncbi:very short patch repair endonuclease [Asticcacaulis sp. AND118]|uniref:very short patch repair endonuclease n=1 Tax=Asticcacaulis sp. AND118 TaxID=2840468 RepID=UPI001D0017C6|nr:DNA mismatch endonuclease Vsr [Asticcacaulis sp. AND118]UDF03282.1 DNA mismatch endonuclease Vsr [Asticcacaulis sp. AND118]